jgi:hypothetical protein
MGQLIFSQKSRSVKFSHMFLYMLLFNLYLPPFVFTNSDSLKKWFLTFTVLILLNHGFSFVTIPKTVSVLETLVKRGAEEEWPSVSRKKRRHCNSWVRKNVLQSSLFAKRPVLEFLGAY